MIDEGERARRVQAAQLAGLPVVLADRLRGATADELVADARLLACKLAAPAPAGLTGWAWRRGLRVSPIAEPAGEAA